MSQSLLTGKRWVVSTGFANSGRRRRAVACQAALAAMVDALESRVLMSSTWFVSPSGSNRNPGTLAAPFQTIQYAADTAHAGDTVEIEAGVYHETVTPPNSGTAGAPITFESYDNESVTIDGADPVTGWTNATGSIYSAQINWNLGEGNNQVFVNGTMVNEARWPATGLNLSHPTVATVASASGTGTTSTIHDAALTQPAGFWVGATMNFTAGDAWVYQSGAVTASGPGWVTFTYQSTGAAEYPIAGNHFYLTGAAAALDAPNEWFLAANGTLSLWTAAGDDPSNDLVEAKARQFGFELSGSSYIDILGIHLFACTINTSSASRGIDINQITAEYLSQFAVTARGWNQPDDGGIVLKGPGDSLANSVIAYSAGDGVYVSGYGSQVTNNVIHDVDYLGGDSAGVVIGVPEVTVAHNTIYNVARSGIDAYSSADYILYNVIHDFGLQTTDCGGVYTIGMNGEGTQIAYNTIYNGITAGNGGTGLFLDNNSSNAIVDHNITYNVNTALKMNMSSLDNTIVNNTLDATQSSINKTSGSANWSGTIIENNIFTHPLVVGNNATISHNVSTTSGFVDPAAGNYQLAAGSSAIGAGIAMAPYAADIGGQAPDAGAIAYGATPFADGPVMSLLPPDPSKASSPPVVAPPSAAAGGPPISATSSILGMDFGAKEGDEAESFGGLGYNLAGNWVEYSNIDFGSGVSTLTIQFAVANAFAGGQIILRLDSPTGPVIGKLVTTGTGSWATYTAQTTAISGATGIHNLYLCFAGQGAMGNVRSFTFS